MSIITATFHVADLVSLIRCGLCDGAPIGPRVVLCFIILQFFYSFLTTILTTKVSSSFLYVKFYLFSYPVWPAWPGVDP